MKRNELKGVSYLGDGVYVGHDGFRLWIFTSNGIEDTNFICLEAEVLDWLNAYANKVMRTYPNPKNISTQGS